MQAIELMESHTQKLRDAEKRIKQLERKAKALAKKQADVEEKRCTWNEQITEQQRAIVLTYKALGP
jgi:chromosome segregation ATPase